MRLESIQNVLLLVYSDVPDSLSGSGRILPFLSDIRIRPDPNRDPADSDLVSKKEYTEN